MKESILCLIIAVLAITFLACGNTESDSDPAETGTLVFTANGEGFVHEGFTSEDGWDIVFDHVYININGPTAFQAVEASSSAARHAGHDHSVLSEGSAHVSLTGDYFLDLKRTGDSSIFEIGSLSDAETGNYNYLNFSVTNASSALSPIVVADGTVSVADYDGYSLVVIGQAEKDDATVNFTLKFTEEMTFYNCGPLIDLDENGTDDGVLAADGTAATQMTFHFDHIFGDYGDTGDDPEPTDPEEINFWGIGFGPFAKLIPGAMTGDTPSAGSFAGVVTQADMAAGLDNAVFFQLMATLKTLGHIGEGHCSCTEYSGE